MAKILLIEPDTILGRTYTKALKAEGHRISHSRHTQDAIHAVDETTPDIVILELQMPGHNGIEFLYEFRSYPEWQHVPILLHTLVAPQALAAHMTSFGQLGIVGYLYKPTTSLKKLAAAISDILQPA